MGPVKKMMYISVVLSVVLGHACWEPTYQSIHLVYLSTCLISKLKNNTPKTIAWCWASVGHLILQACHLCSANKLVRLPLIHVLFD